MDKLRNQSPNLSSSATRRNRYHR